MMTRLVPALLGLLAFLAPLSAPTGLALAESEEAICAVCGPREGAGFEPVKSRATYRGMEYAFCRLECKVEFLKSPEAFLRSDRGTEAPAFRLERLEGGGTLSLDSLRGQVVLLDFWATFCAPCVKALPDLQTLHEKYASKGFSVVGVLVDDRKDLAAKLARKAGVAYPVLLSTPEVWGSYKVNTLPSLVLVDREGRIARRFGGEADRARFIAEIEAALAAATPPAGG
jgi:thiol-disulfide isomerase/thioredoxin